MDTSSQHKSLNEPENPLFYEICALTARADTLRKQEMENRITGVPTEDALPEELVLAINKLITDCLGFCRRNHNYRKHLDSKGQTDEYKKFFTLLKIIAKIAKKIEKVTRNLFCLTGEGTKIEQYVFNHLTKNFGEYIPWQTLHEKILEHSDASLTAATSGITSLQEKLRENEYGLSIALKAEAWDSSGFALIDPEVSLADYAPTELRQFSHLTPLAIDTPFRQATVLPEIDLGKADRERSASLAKSKSKKPIQTGKIHEFGETNIAQSFAKIPNLTAEEKDRLLQMIDLAIRRYQASISRNTNRYFDPTIISKDIEETIEATPEDNEVAKKYIEQLRKFSRIFKYSNLNNDELKDTSTSTVSAIETFLSELDYEEPAEEPLPEDTEEEESEGNTTSETQRTIESFKEASADIPVDIDSALWDLRTYRYEGNEGDNDTLEETAKGFQTRPFMKPCRSIVFDGKIQLAINRLLESKSASLDEQITAKLVMLDLIIRISASVTNNGKSNGTIVPRQSRLQVPTLISAVEKNKLPKDLWDHQKEAITAIARGFDRGLTKMCMETPPGTGKTRDMVTLIDYLQKDGRTLVLEPSVALCYQTAREIARYMRKTRSMGIIAEDRAMFGRDITISTYTSAQRYFLSCLFDPSEFSLVILDEAHRSLSKQRTLISNTFSQAMIIGATACGRDINGKDIGDELEIVYGINMEEGRKRGIINPIELWLEETVPALQEKAKKILEHLSTTCKDGQTMVILDTIDRINQIETLLKGKGIDAKGVHSRLKQDKIKERDESFRREKFHVLLACDMLTEGWDYPPLRNMIMADIPGKEWEFVQRAGRITRKLEGKGNSRLVLLHSSCQDLQSVQSTFGISPYSHRNGTIPNL